MEQKLAKEIFQKKYMLHGEESPSEVFRQVAFEIAMSEEAGAVSSWAQDFQDLMESGQFIPAGRILANARLNPLKPYYNNCYTIDVEDSMKGITKSLTQYMTILKAEGGCGFNLSKLRPEGAPISTGGESTGPLAFAEVYNTASTTISGGGGRRGATMFILDASHPDIKKFITYKRGDENNRLTQMNISVAASDAFMDAVLNDSDWDLVWGGQVFETVRARELMRMILENNKDYAEPGLMFQGNAQRYNNLYYIKAMEMLVTNPCGEIVGAANFVCCLGAMNLTKFVKNPFSGKVHFDTKGFREAIRTAVRFLDNVLDRTNYPIPEIEKQAMDYRRIGLGITGLGDLFAMMGAKYGSQESLAITELVFSNLRNESYSASVDLAIEKGPFPAYDARFLSGEFVKQLPKHLQDHIATNGIRNAYLNTIAPTGTTSLSVGDNCSSGIEPIFALEYDRTYRTGKGDETATEKVYDRAYLDFLEDHPDKDAADYFSVAADLSIEDHQAVQVLAQYYIDQSISKTINLPPGTTLEQMEDVYTSAYINGLKGCTTFHPEGKLKGILTTGGDDSSDWPQGATSPGRPDELPCEIKEFQYRGTKYLALVGMLDGRPYEIFVVEANDEHYNKRRGSFTVRKEDGVYSLVYNGLVFMEDIAERFSFNDSAATVCLMASAELRYGVPITSVVSQLERKGIVTAFPKAVARALKKFIPDEDASDKNPCPECGGAMRRSEGCFICDSCGWGKCG